MTAVTGLVDAVSFISLGHVFTANMTGNIVCLAFTTARVSGLSITCSSTALLAFLVGAILGGSIMERVGADSQIRFAAQALLLEVAFLGAVVIHYSISAALRLATAISSACSVVLFCSGPTPDKR